MKSLLQRIAKKHYDKELAKTYGSVNTLKKDSERKYVSDFPSLNQGANIAGPNDLHTILMKLKPKGKYFDIGCGRGKDIIRYEKKGYDSKGIDISELQVIEARKNLVKVGIKVEKVQWLDALEEVSSLKNFFDLITSLHIYQHFTSEEALIATKNALSMLKDDGVFLLVVKIDVDDWDEYFRKGVKVEVEDEKNYVFRMWDDDLGCWRPGYHLFFPGEIEKIIKEAGGNIIDVPTYKGLMKGVVRHDSGRNFPCVAYYIKKVVRK